MPDPIYTGRQLQAIAYPCEKAEQVKLHAALQKPEKWNGFEYSTIVAIFPWQPGAAMCWHASVSCVLNGIVAKITECPASQVRGMSELAERLLSKRLGGFVGAGMAKKAMSTVSFTVIREVSPDELKKFDDDWRDRPMPGVRLRVKLSQ